MMIVTKKICLKKFGKLKTQYSFLSRFHFKVIELAVKPKYIIEIIISKNNQKLNKIAQYFIMQNEEKM